MSEPTEKLRNITMERLYSLREYENIKFSDTITGIPAELMFNKEVISKLRYIQLLDTEKAYQKYVQIMLHNHTLSMKEIMEYLEQERVHTFEELLAEIDQTTKKE